MNSDYPAPPVLPASGSLYDPVPRKLPQEIVQTLVDSAAVRIERIISDGHRSPPGFWYDQAQREWVLLLSGEAVLEFEDRRLELRPGMYVDIAAHERHRIVATSASEQTIWLAIFY